VKNINGHFPLFDLCFRQLYSRKMWLMKSVRRWSVVDQEILAVDDESIKGKRIESISFRL